MDMPSVALALSGQIGAAPSRNLGSAARCTREAAACPARTSSPALEVPSVSCIPRAASLVASMPVHFEVSQPA